MIFPYLTRVSVAKTALFVFCIPKAMFSPIMFIELTWKW